MFWLFSPYKGLVIDTNESSTPNYQITHNTVENFVAKPLGSKLIFAKALFSDTDKDFIVKLNTVH